jgi:hypothetical protein
MVLKRISLTLRDLIIRVHTTNNITLRNCITARHSLYLSFFRPRYNSDPHPIPAPFSQQHACRLSQTCNNDSPCTPLLRCRDSISHETSKPPTSLHAAQPTAPQKLCSRTMGCGTPDPPEERNVSAADRIVWGLRRGMCCMGRMLCVQHWLWNSLDNI